MVNFRLMLKIVAVGFVSLFLVVPISRVESLVQERLAQRNQVVEDIARSAGYAQTITGPFLVVPYDRTFRTWTDATNDKPRQLVEQVVPGEFIFLPEQFNLSGQVELQERSRGIYKARLFGLSSDLRGEFHLEPNYGVKEAVEDFEFGTPYLVMGVSDIRGIGPNLSLKWNGSAVSLEPNTFPPGNPRGAMLPSVLTSGIHASLPHEKPTEQRVIPFEVEMDLQGTSELRVAPVGRASHVQLASNWPHPSFTGDFLPRRHTITEQGFDANWETSFFSTNLEGLTERCHASSTDAACVELAGKSFAVSFVDPVDHYLKSDRATKYAFLFVGLTFAVFFLFEVLRRMPVHPVQYGLVGLSLAVFFLLLLSLSEHVGFALAYGVSAAASVLVIGYYVVPIFGSARLAAGFAAALTTLYGLLYGILSSEDYALLTGSLVVFAVLGLAMVFTRRVNWSGFGQASLVQPPAPSPSAPSS
jgi:inner membrane protein